MTAGAEAGEILHASCVAIGDAAVLILGPAGSGKSALALRLLALGGRLVADDRTMVSRRQNHLFATCPPALAGMIEARGVGILSAEMAGTMLLKLAVDLSRESPSRLPPREVFTLYGLEIDLICAGGVTNLAAVILQVMKGGFAI